MLHLEIAAPLHRADSWERLDRIAIRSTLNYKLPSPLAVLISSYSLPFPDVVSSDSVSFIGTWLWNHFLYCSMYVSLREQRDVEFFISFRLWFWRLCKAHLGLYCMMYILNLHNREIKLISHPKWDCRERERTPQGQILDAGECYISQVWMICSHRIPSLRWLNPWLWCLTMGNVCKVMLCYLWALLQKKEGGEKGLKILKTHVPVWPKACCVTWPMVLWVWCTPAIYIYMHLTHCSLILRWACKLKAMSSAGVNGQGDKLSFPEATAEVTV